MKADYRCTNRECGIVIEYEKEYGDTFPETLECPDCKSLMNRLYNSAPIMSISEGMVAGVYKGTKFTPKKHLNAYRNFGKDWEK